MAGEGGIHCSEGDRLKEIEKSVNAAVNKVQTLEQNTNMTLHALTLDIRLMAQSMNSMESTLINLAKVYDKYYELDKRLSNNEETIKAVKLIGGAFVVALIGLGVAILFGRG